ncbi:hypothetical protein, partial [Nocardia asiatica]|uniref:hypothetical protein n=1 Tax=Nocardia asiatica TaxID=209252 RepID=UPI002458AA3A
MEQTVLISEARAAAEDWVSRHAEGAPWFHSAHYAGSTVGVPGDRPLPPGSDIDVVVVTSSSGHGPKPGKLRYSRIISTLLLDTGGGTGFEPSHRRYRGARGGAGCRDWVTKGGGVRARGGGGGGGGGGGHAQNA